MAITFTHVYTKKKEYSEFEPDNRVIDVVVFFDPSLIALNDSLRVEIRKDRLNRNTVVLTGSYTFTSIPPTKDYIVISLDMRSAKDADGLRTMRRGEYFAIAIDNSDENNYLESPAFKVSIITVSKIEQTWLFGVSLLSSEVLKPKRQPQKVTGVIITEVTLKHPAIPCILNYQVQFGKKYLSWARGELIQIDTGGQPVYPLQEYFLPGEIGIAGITVSVDPYSLPDSDVQETIVIDYGKIDDNAISDEVNRAVDLIENSLLMIDLEPTIYVTEIDPRGYIQDGLPETWDDYDKIAQPVSYYGVAPNHWINIQFPFQHIQKIEYLAGAIAQNRVVQVRTQWVEKNYLSGWVQIVPLHLEMVFAYFGLAWVPSLWGIRDLPNFWHYRAVAGLRYIPGDLLELMGRLAAIPILSMAGLAYRGGLGAQSISRDGVSESVSFTSSAMYGIYAAYQNDHQNWINFHLPTLRNRYRGIPIRVL